MDMSDDLDFPAVVSSSTPSSMSDTMNYVDPWTLPSMKQKGAAAAASLLKAQSQSQSSQTEPANRQPKPHKVTTAVAAAAKMSWDKLSNQMTKLEKRKQKSEAFKNSMWLLSSLNLLMMYLVTLYV